MITTKNKHTNSERTKYIINIILGTKFDFVKYKAIFNRVVTRVTQQWWWTSSAASLRKGVR
jgi:hypothetical protein